MKRLRVEMKDINEEQREIKEGQRQVREKFEAIELECVELRKETILVTQQTAKTQIRLALMFQILKARQNQELDKAAILTHALRYFSSQFITTVTSSGFVICVFLKIIYFLFYSEVVAREELELDASKK